MGAFLAEVRSGKYDKGMFLGGWSGDNGDPDNFLYPLFASPSMPVGDTSHYKSAEADKLMLDGRQTAAPAKPIEIYKKAQAVILENAPWISRNSGLHTRTSPT